MYVYRKCNTMGVRCVFWYTAAGTASISILPLLLARFWGTRKHQQQQQQFRMKAQPKRMLDVGIMNSMTYFQPQKIQLSILSCLATNLVSSCSSIPNYQIVLCIQYIAQTCRNTWYIRMYAHTCILISKCLQAVLCGKDIQLHCSKEGGDSLA